MNFEEWLESEEGKAVMELVRQHVSYASRETIEQCLQGAYMCAYLEGGKAAVRAA